MGAERVTWESDQWQAFCALAAASWPGEFSEADRKAWRVLLDEIEPPVAIEGLKRLLYSGRQFYPRPAVSDLLAATRDDPSQPTFDEAVALIYRAACFFGNRRVEWLSERAPLVASFVEVQGPDRVFCLPLDDPEWGEKHRRELREAWDRHLQASEGRQVAALASGQEGLRQLKPIENFQLVKGDA